MLKRKPANEFYQKLPDYKGEYEPRQSKTDFESEKEVLMEVDKNLVEKRRSERIYNAL